MGKHGMKYRYIRITQQNFGIVPDNIEINIRQQSSAIISA